VPSLTLRYGLVLRGRFDLGTRAGEEPPPPATRRPRGLAAAAVTLLVAGMVLTPFAEGIGLVIGVLSLVGFIALGAIELLRPDKLADD
jgi:hypothetical protein